MLATILVGVMVGAILVVPCWVVGSWLGDKLSDATDWIGDHVGERGDCGFVD